MPGLFLIIVGTIAFGAFTYEDAKVICPEKVTKECVEKALEPIESANHDNYNK